MLQAAANFQKAGGNWRRFFDLQRRKDGDLGKVEALPHPAKVLLAKCKW